MGRNNAMDGVRAFAALIVLMFHTKVPWMLKGHIGVDVFFVLSGYLITRIIVSEFDQTGSFRFRHFMAARLRRLYPALLVVVAAFALVQAWLFPKANLLAEVVLSLAYLANVTRGAFEQPDILTHTWSLAAEMQFYLIWPIIIVGLCVVARPHLVRILFSLFVAMAIWRWWIQYSGQATPGRIYSSVETRAPALILGGAIAVSGFVPGKRLGSVARGCRFCVSGSVRIASA